MTLLHSIVLSNTRRFAENVRIDIGPGATILLAPNGTGKTTVFEAIELSLSGTISRLNSIDPNLSPFVRDGKDQSRVQLDFGEGLNRTTILNRGTLPTTSGDLGPLLGTVQPKDISYLLRLTHLLDQHDRNWFVEADSNDAGNRLAALPIGKDGIKASSVITGAKKSLTEKRKEIDGRFNEAQLKQAHWQKLLAEREASKVDVGRPLVSLAELVKGLTASASYVNVHIPEKVTLASVKVLISEINSHLEQQFNLLQERSQTLATCDTLVTEFLKANQALDEAKVQLSSLQSITLQNEEQLVKAQTSFDEKDVALQVTLNVHRELLELQQKVTALENAKIQEVIKTDAFKIAEEAASAAEKALLAAKSEHEVSQQAANVHRQLFYQEQNLTKSEAELASAKEMLTRWIAHIQVIVNFDEQINHLTSRIEELTSSFNEERTVLKNRQATLKEAQLTFDAISKSSGVIREAVSTIALHLPTDRDNCPLCGQVHGAEQLQQRMALSLEAIDPALKPAAERLETCRRLVAEIETSIENLTNFIKEARAEIDEVEKNRAAILAELAEIRSNPMFENRDVASAPEALSARSIELEAVRKKLITEKSASVVEPTSEQLAELRQKLLQVQGDHESAQLRLEEARSALRVAQDYRIATEEAIGDSKPDINLPQQQVSIETAIAQAKTGLEEAREELYRHRNARDEAISTMRNYEEMVRSIIDRVNQHQIRWNGSLLDGKPTVEALSLAKEQLSDSLREIENARQGLHTTRSEIARWEAADAFHRAESEVTKFCGNKSEEAFTDYLTDELEKSRS